MKFLHTDTFIHNPPVIPAAPYIPVSPSGSNTPMKHPQSLASHNVKICVRGC